MGARVRAALAGRLPLPPQTVTSVPVKREGGARGFVRVGLTSEGEETWVGPGHGQRLPRMTDDPNAVRGEKAETGHSRTRTTARPWRERAMTARAHGKWLALDSADTSAHVTQTLDAAAFIARANDWLAAEREHAKATGKRKGRPVSPITPKVVNRFRDDSDARRRAASKPADPNDNKGWKDENRPAFVPYVPKFADREV